MSITPEDQAALRRPFPASEVKFRLASNKKTGNLLVLTYIDARHAASRLSEIDPAWEFAPVYSSVSPFTILDKKAAYVGSLTVKGVARCDAGDANTDGWDPQWAKGSVSDALKRCAALFGLGEYLYSLGDTYVSDGQYKVTDKSTYINANGDKFLRDQYAKKISAPEFVARFGTPSAPATLKPETVIPQPEVTYDATKNDTNTPETKPKQTEVSSNQHVEAAVEIAKAAGKSENAIREWMNARDDKEAALARIIEQAASSGKNIGKDVHDTLNARGLEKFIEAFDAVVVH